MGTRRDHGFSGCLGSINGASLVSSSFYCINHPVSAFDGNAARNTATSATSCMAENAGAPHGGRSKVANGAANVRRSKDWHV